MLIPFNNTKDRRGNKQPGLWERYNIKPKGVLHIGANKGEEAPVYYELGVRDVIWIEGDEELIPLLKENISKFEGQKCLCYIIGENDMEHRIFHIANNGGQSSSLLELGTHAIEHPDVFYIKHVPVVTRRIDCLFSESTIAPYDFLNVDLQGNDLPAIRGMGNLLNNFKWACIEINKSDVYKGCEQLPEVEKYMAGFGFQLVESYNYPNKTWGDGIFIKR